MRPITIIFLLFLDKSLCMLWTNGVVHFSINEKDYDVHSQDIITSTLAELQNEVCLKFFNIPSNYSASEEKVLYISNPNKEKSCPPKKYDFSKTIVDMPIGYKCLNERDIARIVVEMLKSSIGQTVSTINSYDLINKFQEVSEDPSSPTLLNPEDRNFINAHYHNECGFLTQRSSIDARRSGGPMADAMQLSEGNIRYYENMLWPMGIVMFKIDEKLRRSELASLLQFSMRLIELHTCVVFQRVIKDDVLDAKNYLYFSSDGVNIPHLGFKSGVQSINLDAMVNGTAGHKSHTLNMLMRVLGIPMMSNRFDRDNYVKIIWNNIDKGMEYLFEKSPEIAWVRMVPYDFLSVTHAPGNYMCQKCSNPFLLSVEPVQDHLWQRLWTMGHQTSLSAHDKQLVDMLYGNQCQKRYIHKQ